MRVTRKILPVVSLFLGFAPVLAQTTTERQTRPIELGTSGGSISDLDNPYCCGGTLGCLVQNAAGDLFILSNNHVLARVNRASIGESAVQPGLIDVGCAMITNDIVANLSDYVPLDFGGGITPCDAAIAQVVPGTVDPSGSILGGIGPLSANTLAATIGLSVQKTGRTTGHTVGSVSTIDTTVNVGYSNRCGRRGNKVASFTGQIVITPGSFSDGGDSGSCIVENVANNPRAVGLLFAGSTSTTIANPIDDVLAALNVSMVGGTPPPVTTGTVMGTVTSTAGGAIAGANVQADTGESDTTDGNGVYTLTNVPTGSRTVTASASGYTSDSQPVTVNENQTSTLDLALSPIVQGSAAIVDCITYTTSGGPQGDKHLNITVTVIDDQDSPVSGASVTIDVTRDGASAGSATGTTDGSGNVTFGSHNAANGCYHTDVTNIVAAGLSFDGAEPANGFMKGSDATPDMDCQDGGTDCGGVPFGGVATVPGPHFAQAPQVSFASQERFARAVIVKRLHEDQLFARDASVIGVGVGHVNGRPVIDVFIDEDAPALPVLPSLVDNVPVHVVPTSPFVSF